MDPAKRTLRARDREGTAHSVERLMGSTKAEARLPSSPQGQSRIIATIQQFQ